MLKTTRKYQKTSKKVHNTTITSKKTLKITDKKYPKLVFQR